MRLRHALAADFSGIVALNEREEQQTSPMDLGRLGELDTVSSYHRVVEVQGVLAAFLIAMRSGTDYRNDNYGWFAARYASFMYVDRIVVSREFAGLGLGSELYRDLFDAARSAGLKAVVCEYNIEPPNPASAAFHDKWGFREVGTQLVAGGAKRVSLQFVAL